MDELEKRKEEEVRRIGSLWEEAKKLDKLWGELQQIRGFRDEGLLTDIHRQILNSNCVDGEILLACGDGDRTPEAYKHLLSVGKGQRRHYLTLNGGPWLMSRNHKVPQHWHLTMRDHLRGSFALKQIPTVIMMGHWPCGQACHLNVGLEEYLHDLAVAKSEIKLLFNNSIIVVPLFHVDPRPFGDRLRTYFSAELLHKYK